LEGASQLKKSLQDRSIIQNRIQTPRLQGQYTAMAGVFEPLNAAWRGFSTGWPLPSTSVNRTSLETFEGLLWLPFSLGEAL
jgi:hypothetical protein